jgi:hypothetical protein
VTFSVAVPLKLELVAFTVNVPDFRPAVAKPAVEIVFWPVIVHVTVGCGERVAPNWSFTVDVNCCVPFKGTVAEEGVTEILAAARVTITFTSRESLRPPASVAVTRSV